MQETRIKHYHIIIERGVDGYFVARVPSLPGCMTQAKTYEEVIDRAKEAIQLCREVAAQDTVYRKRTETETHAPTFVGVADVTA